MTGEPIAADVADFEVWNELLEQEDDEAESVGNGSLPEKQEHRLRFRGRRRRILEEFSTDEADLAEAAEFWAEALERDKARLPLLTPESSGAPAPTGAWTKPAETATPNVGSKPTMSVNRRQERRANKALAVQRKADDAAGKAEEAKRTEEARKAEAERKAEQACQAEAARKAEAERKAEEAKQAKEARAAHKAARRDERAAAKTAKREAREAAKAEEARIAEEAKRAEAERKAEEARQAKEQRQADKQAARERMDAARTAHHAARERTTAARARLKAERGGEKELARDAGAAMARAARRATSGERVGPTIERAKRSRGLPIQRREARPEEQERRAEPVAASATTAPAPVVPAAAPEPEPQPTSNEPVRLAIPPVTEPVAPPKPAPVVALEPTPADELRYLGYRIDGTGPEASGSEAPSTESVPAPPVLPPPPEVASITPAGEAEPVTKRRRAKSAVLSGKAAVVVLVAAILALSGVLVAQSRHHTSTPPATATHATTVPTTAASTPHPATASAGSGSAALAPCTAADVTVTTATAGTTFAPGQSVPVLSKITDVRPCAFTPVAQGPYHCSAMVVVQQGSTQVWPAADQIEQCSPAQPISFETGAAESVSAVWNPPAATHGLFSAAGTWSWSGANGQPVVVSASSAPFTVS